MREVELALNGVLGPDNFDIEWGIDLYVNSAGELKLFIHNPDDRGEARLDKVQALALSEALREYYDGQTDNNSGDSARQSSVWD